MLIIAFSFLTSNYQFLIVLLFSILHEMGHILTLFVFKSKPKRITVAYYGIGLKYSARLNFSRELVFLISGVMVNLAFVILNWHREINLILLLINSMPIYPLDGGRALKLILGEVLSYSVSNVIFKIISAVFLIILFALAIYIKSVSLALITIYVIIYSINSVE